MKKVWDNNKGIILLCLIWTRNCLTKFDDVNFNLHKLESFSLPQQIA